MKNEKSLTQKQYEAHYRHLRKTGGTLADNKYSSFFDDAQDCAVISYDCQDSEFSGWINRQRLARFRTVKISRHEWRELPF